MTKNDLQNMTKRLLVRRYSLEEQVYYYPIPTTSDGIEHSFYGEDIYNQIILNEPESKSVYEQCTGFCDKDKTLIFDGDVVAFSESADEFYLEKVIFDKTNGNYIFADSGVALSEKAEVGTVVGNIHRDKIYLVKKATFNDEFKKNYIDSILSALQEQILNVDTLKNFLHSNYAEMLNDLEQKNFEEAFEKCVPSIIRQMNYCINFEDFLQQFSNKTFDNHIEVVEDKMKTIIDLETINLKELNIK